MKTAKKVLIKLPHLGDSGKSLIQKSVPHSVCNKIKVNLEKLANEFQ